MVERPVYQVDSEVLALDGLVYRQVHHKQIDASRRVMSGTFNPLVTGGQEGKRLRVLSAYDGGQVSAEDAYRHYTEELGLSSVGVLALSVQECVEMGIEVDHDGRGFPAHVSLRFPRLSRRATTLLARDLIDLALARGWQYRPVAEDAE